MKINPNNTIITTLNTPETTDEDSVKELSIKLGIPFFNRGNLTISRLLKECKKAAALVVDRGSIKLVYNGNSFYYHPNMAALRISNLKKGKRDRFIDISGIKDGDRVLDCTMGLAADSLVISYITGVKGEVLALEKSAILCEVVKSGLKNYDDEQLKKYMKRIKIKNIDYYDFLTHQPENSWDIVYIDPMFEKTRDKAKGLDIVRSLGENTPPDMNAIKEAIRVANRSVVIKDSPTGSIIKKLGIPLVSRGKKVCYGRFDIKKV